MSSSLVHDLPNCRQLQQDANVTSGGEKIVGAKIQQLYRPKVVSVRVRIKTL